MKEKLIAALKNFFGLKKSDALSGLAQNRDAMAIGGLKSLIESLDEAGTPPKIIAQDLEDVILQIVLKEKPSVAEQNLLKVLENIQEAPESDVGNSFSV